MQTENKLFEDFSKVATAAMGTLAGVTREVSEDARRRARDFVGTADAVDRDEFEAAKANAVAAREAVETLRTEIASLRTEIASLKAEIRSARVEIAAPAVDSPPAA
ncbi:accessory factor UbiK family protein [Polymorphobacter fuscus]|uniref:Accessory factor UbiK family protein n=1 Tax=Sandarakinorhabdus fusca TaxID=1439888 RepID=A0A7C9KK47_9SPHN|nr:accessory factor UbiK family protein [Polymorphobacter fuscus]KAB7644132.1 accessory factor UbiK family protein [Polymorphobacter fuscus]MQT18519.1 accessory factor UbiK family protein [Polymorphobacter fuscus]NJC08358.1 BMFP domain-containing protein YqiC [Polymorphobacter fuscus]